MKVRLACLAAVSFWLAPAPQALADEAHAACMRAEGADLAVCGEQWLKREEASLDIEFQAMLAQTDSAVRDALAAEQAAWTDFYQAACAFMRDPVFAPGGDLATFYTCRAGAIGDRLRQVRAYATYVDN